MRWQYQAGCVLLSCEQQAHPDPSVPKDNGAGTPRDANGRWQSDFQGALRRRPGQARAGASQLL